MQTLFCLLPLTRKTEEMRLGSMLWAWRTTRHFSLGEIGPLINNRALQIQKANQKSGNSTVRTFLIFDDNKTKANKLIKLLWKPPDWTDDDYGRKKGQDPLDQIIDTPFSIKSHHAGLVQVADLLAFILRRYAEIEDYNAEEAWPGEKTCSTNTWVRLRSGFSPNPRDGRRAPKAALQNGSTTLLRLP